MYQLKKHIGALHAHGLHWQFLYHRRAGWHGVSTRQIIASQVFTVFASVLAGLLLDITKENLVILVGTLIMLPGIIDLAATLTGVMCAKIHHQIDETDVPPWLVTVHAITFAILMSVLAGLIVGVVGGAIGAIFFAADFGKLIALTLLSMFFIGSICFPLMALFTLLVRRLGLNPDNISGPVESSVVDVVAILVVAIIAGWLA